MKELPTTDSVHSINSTTPDELHQRKETHHHKCAHARHKALLCLVASMKLVLIGSRFAADCIDDWSAYTTELDSEANESLLWAWGLLACLINLPGPFFDWSNTEFPCEANLRRQDRKSDENSASVRRAIPKVVQYTGAVFGVIIGVGYMITNIIGAKEDFSPDPVSIPRFHEANASEQLIFTNSSSNSTVNDILPLSAFISPGLGTVLAVFIPTIFAYEALATVESCSCDIGKKYRKKWEYSGEENLYVRFPALFWFFGSMMALSSVMLSAQAFVGPMDVYTIAFADLVAKNSEKSSEIVANLLRIVTAFLAVGYVIYLTDYYGVMEGPCLRRNRKDQDVGLPGNSSDIRAPLMEETNEEGTVEKHSKKKSCRLLEAPFARLWAAIGVYAYTSGQEYNRIGQLLPIVANALGKIDGPIGEEDIFLTSMIGSQVMALFSVILYMMSWQQKKTVTSRRKDIQDTKDESNQMSAEKVAETIASWDEFNLNQEKVDNAFRDESSLRNSL